MPFLLDALPGILPPALVAALLLVPSLRVGDPGRLHGLRGAALGVGFATGFVALFGIPPMPAAEAWQWLPWLALAGAGLAGIPAALRGAVWMRAAGRLLVTAAAAWLTLSPFQEWLGWNGAALAPRLGLLAVVWTSLWASLEKLGRRRPGPALPMALTLSATATSVLCLLAGGARLAQLGGVLATVAGVATAAAWWRPALAWNRGAVAVGVLLHGALVLNSWLALSPDLPTTAAVLLGLAPLMAWAGEWRSTAAEGRSPGALLRRAIFLVAPLLLAAWLVWQAQDGGALSYGAG